MPIDEDVKRYFKEYEQELTVDQLLVKASSYGIIEYVKKYLDMGADINCNGNKTPLFHAIALDDLSVAEFLLQNGADVNNPPGMVADFIELEYNYFEADYYGIRNAKPKLEIIKLLLKYGADANALNISGQSALEQIVKYFSINEIDFLLTNGANINVKNKAGKTALDITIEIQRDSKFIEELRKRGAKISKEINII